MAAESLVQMLEEIAVGLKAGDEEIYGWLREQLKECGASEISVELAMGVIARLLPEEAQGNLEAAQQLRPPLGALTAGRCTVSRAMRALRRAAAIRLRHREARSAATRDARRSAAP